MDTVEAYPHSLRDRRQTVNRGPEAPEPEERSMLESGYQKEPAYGMRYMDGQGRVDTWMNPYHGGAHDW